jgi:adenosylcobinamide-GDP ribazoletransferase
LRLVHEEIRLLLTALQFFTRIPVPAWVGYSDAQLNAAARHFPLVGALVGAICAAVYGVASLIFPVSVGVLLGLAAGVWLTGAFHEDGLADTCDGLGGGQTRDRALEIMKDSRIGSYAAVGLVLVLLGKFAALSALPPALIAAAFLAGHAFSRLMALSVMLTQDYVRDAASARSKPMAQGIGARAFTWAAACAGAPLLLLGAPGAAGAGAALLVRVWFGRLLARRLGGYTGDTLGATQQGSELAFYLGVLAAIGR